MSSIPGLTYQATKPPGGATCDTPGCCSAAKVRMIIPPSRFEADGIDHSKDPPTFDTCDLHWPGIRDACVRGGHTVADITGDIGELVADFPQWSVFASDGGRLYAADRVNGAGQGVTLDAYLVGQLRGQLQEAQVPGAVDAGR